MNLTVKVEKIDENNRRKIIESLKSDVVRHVFAIYDLQHDPNHTTVHAAFENGNLKGYILTYTALRLPSVILECENSVARQLLNIVQKTAL